MSDAADEIPDSFTLAGMSWVILREAADSMPTLVASGVIAYGLVSLVDRQLQFEVAASIRGIADGGVRAIVLLLASLPQYFLHAIVLAAIAIPIHRLVLRDEKADGPVKLFASPTLEFAFWLVAMQIAYFAVLLPLPLLANLVPALASLFVMIGIVAGVALFVAITRASLLFPAIALGLPVDGAIDRLLQAWALSRGFFWRILLSTFFALVPLVIVLAFLSWGVLALLIGFGVGDSLSEMQWWSAIVTTLSRPVGAVLGAAALSWNFRFATFSRTRDAGAAGA